MRLYHFIKRGNRYSFICRIPSDLLHHFPKKTIWKTLKTGDNKDAALLAKAEEFRLQQLFLHLRSGMFPKELEQWLVASYTMGGIELIESQQYREPIERAAEGKMDKRIASEINKNQAARAKQPEELQAEYEFLQAAFRAKDPFPETFEQDRIGEIIFFSGNTGGNCKGSAR